MDQRRNHPTVGRTERRLTVIDLTNPAGAVFEYEDVEVAGEDIPHADLAPGDRWTPQGVADWLSFRDRYPATDEDAF